MSPSRATNSNKISTWALNYMYTQLEYTVIREDTETREDTVGDQRLYHQSQNYLAINLISNN